MENKSSDFEKRQCIRNLIRFLEQNKETIKNYENLELFRQNINDLYTSVKKVSYDSIEFDVPENVDINESVSYYYYSENHMFGVNKIAIINKSFEKLYFLNIINDVNYEIIKYHKNKNNRMIISKRYRNFNSAREAKNYKALILKPIINN